MNKATREAVRAMRIYAQDGAKSLSPWLDADRPRRACDHVRAIAVCRDKAQTLGDIPACVVLMLVGRIHWKHAKHVWRAYWGRWEIGPDGEPRDVSRDVLPTPHVLTPTERMLVEQQKRGDRAAYERILGLLSGTVTP